MHLPLCVYLHIYIYTCMYVCLYGSKKVRSYDPTWISFVQVIEWLGVMGWLRQAEASDDEKCLAFTALGKRNLILVINLGIWGWLMAQDLFLHVYYYLNLGCLWMNIHLPASLVCTKIAGSGPMPNLLLGTTSAGAFSCWRCSS